MRNKMMIPAVLGAVLLAACQPVEPEEKPAENGSLAITVEKPFQTKASTDAVACENQLNKMRVLVYDSEGSLYKDEALSSPFTSTTIPNVKAGSYNVYALANSCAALSDVSTMTALSGTTVKLSDCSLTASTGFAMFSDKVSSSVIAGTTPTAVNLQVVRYPARVKLISVKNELPATLGSLTVNSVMLINGYSEWTLGASGSPTKSVNPAGRKDGTGDIIASASNANYPDHTFKAVPSADQTIANGAAAKTYGYSFYSFPNLVTSDVIGPKSVGGKARLVVTASINGKTYYYPVTLAKMERNKCYEVTLTISGAGSDDPNRPVEKGSMGVTIDVKGWVSGADYTETI